MFQSYPKPIRVKKEKRPFRSSFVTSKEKKKSKIITVSKAKKKAWNAFSIYIRLRDCIRTTNTLDLAKCITCDKVYSFKKLQAGHWIPGRHNSILFDERGCYAQCYHCNVGLKGNPVKYFRKMQAMQGEEVMKELEFLDTQERPYKVWQLQSLELQLIERTEQLKNAWSLNINNP
jgi:hypothetical protein